MKSVIVILFFLCAAAAGQTAPGAVTDEPGYKQVLANPKVRVFEAEIPAGKGTTLHTHEHDYVLISLSQGVLVESRYRSGRALPGRRSRFQVGETQLVGGGLTHVLRNPGATPYRAVFVELLEGPGEAPPSTPSRRRNPCVYPAGGISDKCPGTFTQKRTWKGATISGHQLAAGDSTGEHTHKSDHLAVAVTALHLKNESQGKVSEMQQPAGAVAWVPAGTTHTLTNAAGQPARYVTVEFQ